MSRPSRATFRIQEGGLVLVILVLGALLAVFGGSVRLPQFETLPDGTRQRVFTVDATGDKTPVFETKNKFLNAQNLAQLAKDTSFVAIMAVGMTFVIIAGQIDLSVGAVYALASVLGALVLQQFGPDGAHAGSPLLGAGLGALTCLGIGLLCGGLNGGMVVGLRVHPFIITLGTMAIFRGIAFVTTKGQSIGGFPASFRDAIAQPTLPGSGGQLPLSVGGLSLVPLLVMLFVTIVGAVYLTRLAAGRRVYAVGGNELASRFSGIRVGRVKLGVFLCSGLAAGLAALISLGYYGAATSGDGQGYELSVIAAAVVGGASLTGGRGSALGALLGALVIQMISSGIVIVGIDQSYSQIIIGAVVILAVLLDQLNAWLMKRRLKQAAPAGH
jgi:ribose/xylose/arabinose/galactoside ABC-type transport system permease subunit